MPKPRRKVRFANSTEEHFAALLHRLRLRWQYEPHTFVLRSRPDGSPALAFTPDFYLPDLGVYFELTTLRQRLVTAKNRKARLLTEQRPDVWVKLLYRRDCQEILRPVRSWRSREALLRRLLPAPTEEVLGRARWLLRLPRTCDQDGTIAVLGVRLPLGPEWSGRKVTAWVYRSFLEVACDDFTIARFPCRYHELTHTLESVEPGVIVARPDLEQGKLAIPELDRLAPRLSGPRSRHQPRVAAVQPRLL